MDDNEIQKIFADGESWPLHWDIRRYLMTERNEQDRWLTDFSKAWAGPRDHEGQLLTGRPPKEYVDAWYRINGPESNHPHRQHKDYSQVIGNAIMLHATTSGVVLQLGGNTIHVDPDDLQPLIDSLIAAKAVVGPMAPTPQPPVAGQRSVAFSHSQNYKVAYGDDRPSVVAFREANEQRSEYALQNERRTHMDSAISRLSALASQARRY